MIKHIRKKKHKKAPAITDHAIVQFLHRSGVIDIKAARQQLMTKELRSALAMSRAGTPGLAWEYNENGLQYIIRDGFVLTILTYDDLRAPNGERFTPEPGTHIMQCQH